MPTNHKEYYTWCTLLSRHHIFIWWNSIWARLSRSAHNRIFFFLLGNSNQSTVKCCFYGCPFRRFSSTHNVPLCHHTAVKLFMIIIWTCNMLRAGTNQIPNQFLPYIISPCDELLLHISSLQVAISIYFPVLAAALLHNFYHKLWCWKTREISPNKLLRAELMEPVEQSDHPCLKRAGAVDLCGICSDIWNWSEY